MLTMVKVEKFLLGWYAIKTFAKEKSLFIIANMFSGSDFAAKEFIYDYLSRYKL